MFFSQNIYCSTIAPAEMRQQLREKTMPMSLAVAGALPDSLLHCDSGLLFLLHLPFPLPMLLSHVIYDNANKDRKPAVRSHRSVPTHTETLATDLSDFLNALVFPSFSASLLL